MATLRFRTDRFDVTRERENPINPIQGESLLLWLRERLGPAHTMPEPAPEDWGWYSDLRWDGRAYLIGATVTDQGPGQMCDWIVQIDKHRSMTEKLLGRARMDAADPCLAFVRGILAAEPDFLDLVQED